ncbi:MAG: metal-sensitive transcriptional regulator [Clostridia bacterium]|jgi:DNA-binding FrmR family transcriptional regulator|nr:metal-sensitive transcriptional regulator [Clostridia bacterium]
MKTPEQRINNIIGQLEGVKKMMANKKDCLLVLIQMKALKSAISSLSIQILSNELDSCLDKKIAPIKKIKIETILKELVKQ